MLGDRPGGFRREADGPETSAAIVYKATWPDEKIIRTTVGKLEDAAAANGINRTALIFVGEFLGDQYDRSKLYDPTFSHGYRGGVQVGKTSIKAARRA